MVTGRGDDEDEDVMKVLVATDCHLGYMEKDATRGSDSMTTFEEILNIAQNQAVDFILLGGDLYHENKPSRKCLHDSMKLFRKYCMGDRPCQVEFLSDQSVNFGHTPFPVVNYEDPNLNVSLPVFSIHGNHDDPSGQGNLCSLDLLSAAGLVNYFGKCTSLEKVEMSPLLLQKGTTKLALYGVGSLRDERLHRLFVNKNVTMLRPKEEQDTWFNLLVLHQNRSKHGPTNYIPEQFLDDFLDLIVWGHEHECKIDPQWNGIRNFYITQPGSSIATSLSEGESVPKHVGLLKIKGNNFKLSKIPLKTVRPFYMEEVILCDTSLNPDDPDCQSQVEAYCKERVEALLEKSESEGVGNEERPDKPLIRLRVDYSGGFEPFNINRFGQRYADRVANPREMVLFTRKRASNPSNKEKLKDTDALKNYRPEALDSARVEDMVKEYFTKSDQKMQMNLLTEKGMGRAVQEYVDKAETDAIPELVKLQLQKTQKHLKERETNEERIDLEIQSFREERQRGTAADEEVEMALKSARSNTKSQNDDFSLSDSDDNNAVAPTSTRGRGRGRGRGKASEGTRGRGRGGRGRGKAANTPSNRTILESFNSQRSSKVKKEKYSRDSEEEETVIQDSDEEDMFSRIPPSRKRNTQSSRSQHGKGIMYSDDDDDDPFGSISMSSKRRR